ncbi:hypothetical protein ABID92_001882 [Frigoribacterium sp. PvP120]|uniref:hypothetical protein n=1 Tax=unclassified Frigoribacterium TaxID=2627005 RepID=UPI001AEAB516|nr:hypothetical protein [Frigoribacterium sp. PvP121]MBP1240184.1 hypothetical protein [Frigoribacterium sp. PvP121]
MLYSEWAPVVAAVAVTIVLGVAAVILRRIRPSRLRATGGVAVPSWPAVREASSALTERDLRGLRAEFRVGTAGSGIAAGLFVALLVERRWMRPTTFDVVASGLPANPVGSLELLLTTEDPAEVLDLMTSSGLTFLPPGPEADVLWDEYFR